MSCLEQDLEPIARVLALVKELKDGKEGTVVIRQWEAPGRWCFSLWFSDCW